MKAVLYVITIMILMGPVNAADILVDAPVTKSKIQAAINTAQPGDHIVIPDGEWRMDSYVDIWQDKSGLGQGQETVIRGQNPGQAILTGQAQFRIYADWMVIRDLYFKDTVQATIVFRGSHHSRVTDCLWENHQVRNSIWIENNTDPRHSEHIRVDHCTWLDPHKCVIFIQDGYGIISVNVTIDHNLIKDMHATVGLDGIPGTPDDELEGSEGLGLGSYFNSGDIDTDYLVEYNIFDNVAKDPETISVKSSGNIFRYNVFKNSKNLQLRMANRCVIDSNYFFGETGMVSYGIGVRGYGHNVTNNYMYQVGQVAGKPAIGIGGTADTYDNLIAHNTIINPGAYAIRTGASVLPSHDIHIVNNIFSLNQGSLWRDWDEGAPDPYDYHWENNIAHLHGTATLNYDSGIKINLAEGEIETGDPMFTTRSTPDYPDLLVLSSGSVDVIDKGSDLEIYHDIDGHARDASPDIGTDEYSALPPDKWPVRYDQVGPSWMNPDLTCEDRGYICCDECEGSAFDYEGCSAVCCNECKQIEPIIGIIEAENAQIVAPFEIRSDTAASNGMYVMSTRDSQGSVTLNLYAEEDGKYIIEASVLASAANRNSFFVGIDSSHPGEDYYIFDMAESADYITEKVSIRGDGSMDEPEFDPYILDLTAGEHTITFSARESNTWLDWIQLVRCDTIDMTELIEYLNSWKGNEEDISISDVMIKINEWRLCN